LAFADRQLNQAQWLLTSSYTTGVCSFDLIQPQVNAVTFMNLKTSNSGANATYLGGGIHNASYQADGLTLYPSTSTMSGSISIYGYNV